MLLKIAQTFNEQSNMDRFVPTFAPTYHRGKHLLSVSKAHMSSLSLFDGGEKQLAQRLAHNRQQSLYHPKLGR